MSSSDPLLARNWKTSSVLTHLDARETVRLVCFLRKRYSERFFEPMHLLRSASGNEQGFGSTLMAVCCLLIETLQCYREGLPSSHKGELTTLIRYAGVPPEYRITDEDLKIKGQEIFRRFFSDNQRSFPCVSGITFYHSIRNGLLHQAQTRNGWTINIRKSKLWDEEHQSIDRDLFSCQLESCFSEYLSDLSTKPFDGREWEKAAKKVWWLCRLSRNNG